MDLSFLYTRDPFGHFSFRYARMRNTIAPVLAAGAATPPASPASTTTASTPGSTATTPGSTTLNTPATGSTPAAASGDEIPEGDWRSLRTKYDQAKARASVLEKLPVPADQLESFVSRWSGVATEATTIAKELGYEDADFKTAFENDPIATLNLLRREKQEQLARTETARRPGESDADMEKRIQAMVDKAQKPYTDHLNKQISDQVTAKIGQEFTTALKAALPDAPTEVNQLIEDYVTESLTYDNNALVAMKARGDYSSVAEKTQFVVGRLKSVFAKWAEHERARGTGNRTTTPGTAPANGAAKTGISLDDIINDPGVINPKYSA